MKNMHTLVALSTIIIPLFTKNSRSLLMALRTRTVRGIKSDFPGLYRDKICPVGCGENDTIQNVLT